VQKKENELGIRIRIRIRIGEEGGGREKTTKRRRTRRTRRKGRKGRQERRTMDNKKEWENKNSTPYKEQGRVKLHRHPWPLSHSQASWQARLFLSFGQLLLFRCWCSHSLSLSLSLSPSLRE
jgi:hypothetical protein